VTSIPEALSGRFGPVVERFRYEHRTRTNTPVQALEGVVLPGGELDLDSDRPTVRTCRLTLDQAGIDALATPFDPASDHVAVFLELLVDSTFTAFQIGLFRLDVVDRDDRPDGTLLSVEGADVAIHLLEDWLTAPLTVAAGTNYVVAIRAQLDAVGLSHTIPAVAAVLPADRTWAPLENSRWDVVRELAFSINRFDPWARADGTIITRERIDPSSEAADVAYSTETEPKLLVPGTRRRENRSRFTNRLAVKIDHPARPAGFELRVNNDPASPISIASTGKTVTDEIVGGIILDLTTAGEIAAYELRDAAARALLREIETVADPRRDAHEFYMLEITTIEASTLWRAQSWTLPLAVGEPMRHTLGRAAPVTITEP